MASFNPVTLAHKSGSAFSHGSPLPREEGRSTHKKIADSEQHIGLRLATDKEQSADAIISQIRTWLNPTQYDGDGSEYQKHCSSHAQGTSQWILQSPIYQEWRESEQQRLLRIRGIPGSGKSVIASEIVKRLTEEENCPVLYFFLCHTIESNDRPDVVLRDWLAQVLQFSPVLQSTFVKEMEHPVETLTTARLHELLRLALEALPRAFCILDALDEMEQHMLLPFLDIISQIGSMQPGLIKVVFTCRPIFEIERHMRDMGLLDISLDKELIGPDITTYLRARLALTDIAQESHSKITEGVLSKGQGQGLFLYAKLAFDAISRAKTDYVEAIERLPVQLSTMYDSLLKDNIHRTGISEELHLLVLKLVIYATRPLRLLEVADCIKVTQPQYGDDVGQLKILVRAICGTLLEILPDETIRVVHHSLTEHLLGITREPNHEGAFAVFEPGPTHNQLALTCLAYLGSGCLDLVDYGAGARRFRPRGLDSSQLYPPFISYIGSNWFSHLTKAASKAYDQQEAIRVLEKLLITSNEENLEKIRLLAKLTPLDLRENGEYLRLEAAVLLLAIELDLVDFAEHLLKEYGSELVEYNGSRRITPCLHLAVRQDNERMVSLLLQHGADINQYDSGGRTPLHVIVDKHSWYGEPERPMNPVMVKTLLGAGADPWKDMEKGMPGVAHHKPGDPSFPPVKCVFYANHVEIAEIFFPYLNDPKAVTRALFWIFAHSANLDMIQSLLNHRHFDINEKGPKDYCQVTPLFLACSMRDPRLIKLFIAAGADPNIPHQGTDTGGKVSYDPHNIVGLNVFHALVGSNIWPKSRAFSKEVLEGENESHECFRLVVDAGADVNQVDGTGKTGFHVVEIEVALECLCEINPSGINAQDHDGRTPLLAILSARATRKDQGRLKLVLKLLELGADPSIVDKWGVNALHLMADFDNLGETPCKEILQKIIELGVDPKIRSSDGKTPFHRMVQRKGFGFKEKNYQTFMDITQADVDAKNGKGRTPLFEALSVGYGNTKDTIAFCQWMKNAGARFDATDQYKRTLLHVADHHPYDGGELMRFLAEAGADPNQLDMDGNTIWHAAVPRLSQSGGSWQDFSAITALGADVAKANHRGRLPLHILSRYHHDPFHDFPGHPMKRRSLLGYLLACSPDSINSVDNDGVAPLHTASTFCYKLTSRLLEMGADITLKTNENLTVFHIAARSKETNILGILVDWFRSDKPNMDLADFLDTRDTRGCTALYYACASGQLESVKLLLEAGATVDSSAYNGSVWNGVAAFETEAQKRIEYARARLMEYDPRHNCYSVRQNCGGVLLSDYLAPRKHGQGHPNTIGRIDEIVELLAAKASDSGRRFINEAIASAVTNKCDYTVELLMHARTALAIDSPLDCREEADQCLGRRAQLLTKDQIDRFPQDALSYMTDPCFGERKYDLMLSLTNEYNARAHHIITGELEKVLHEIIKSGFASLLDEMLTPSIISILSGNKQGNEYDPKQNKIVLRPLLHSALTTEKPNMSVVRVLVEKGAGLEDQNEGSGYRADNSTALSVLLGRPTWDTDDRIYWWQIHQALPYLLSRGANLEAKDRFNRTPLFLVVEGADTSRWKSKSIEILLQAGADPNVTDKGGQTCLALARRKKAAYQMLLDHGAVISPSALISAVDAKDIDSLRLMLCSGADPNMRNPGEEIPERTSADGRRMTPARHDPTPDDKQEHYLLDYILGKFRRRRDKDSTKTYMPFLYLLLEHGADVNAKYQKTSIVERMLMREGDLENQDDRPWLRAILGHPALDVEARNKDGSTHLLVACSGALLPAIEILLDRGANILARDKQDRNALHHLFEHPRFTTASQTPKGDPPYRMDVLDKILSLAPELLHQVDQAGKTPLLSAVKHRPYSHGIETLVSLNRAGASVANTKTGDTPLHLVVGGYWDIDASGEGEPFLFGRNLELMDLFLANGGNINARNLAGETPIFNFFRNGSVRSKFLDRETRIQLAMREAGLPHPRIWNEQAVLDINAAKQRVLDHERRGAKEDVVMELLDRHGVDWHVINTEGQSLLHVIAGDPRNNDHKRFMAQKKAERFQFVMGKGLDILADDMENRTPLDLAAATETDEILDMVTQST